jgi:hypothetical protein
MVKSLQAKVPSPLKNNWEMWQNILGNWRPKKIESGPKSYGEKS